MMNIAFLVAPRKSQSVADPNRKLSGFYADRCLLRHTPDQIKRDINCFKLKLMNWRQKGLTDFIAVHVGTHYHDIEAKTLLDEIVEEVLGLEGTNFQESILVDARDCHEASLEVIDRILTFGPSSKKHIETPDFRKLSNEGKYETHLNRLWKECQTCLQANAELAAVVMMGSLLEGVLMEKLSTFNALKFEKLNTTPKYPGGKVQEISKWQLEALIEVAHEIGLINATSRSLGKEIQLYRNKVHPREAIKSAEIPTASDAKGIWSNTRRLVEEILQ